MPVTSLTEKSSMFLDLRSQLYNGVHKNDYESLVFEEELKDYTSIKSIAGRSSDITHTVTSHHDKGYPVNVKKDFFCNRIRCEGRHFLCIGCDYSSTTRHSDHMICISASADRIDGTDTAKYITHQPTFAIGAFNLYSNYDGLTFNKELFLNSVKDMSSEQPKKYGPTCIKSVQKLQPDTFESLLYKQYEPNNIKLCTPTLSVTDKTIPDTSYLNYTSTETIDTDLSSNVSSEIPVTNSAISPNKATMAEMKTQPQSHLEFLHNLTNDIKPNKNETTSSSAQNLLSILNFDMNETAKISDELKEKTFIDDPIDKTSNDIPMLTPVGQRSVSLEDRRFSSKPLLQVYEIPQVKTINKNIPDHNDLADLPPLRPCIANIVTQQSVVFNKSEVMQQEDTKQYNSTICADDILALNSFENHKESENLEEISTPSAVKITKKNKGKVKATKGGNTKKMKDNTEPIVQTSLSLVPKNVVVLAPKPIKLMKSHNPTKDGRRRRRNHNQQQADWDEDCKLFIHTSVIELCIYECEIKSTMFQLISYLIYFIIINGVILISTGNTNLMNQCNQYLAQLIFNIFREMTMVWPELIT